MKMRDKLEQLEELACGFISQLDYLHFELWERIGEFDDAVKQMETKGKKKQGAKALGHACERLIQLVDEIDMPAGIGRIARKRELVQYVEEEHKRNGKNS